MKTAEQFFRDKAFPLGIDDDEWTKWKHTHKGINWQGFSIKAMEEYAEEVKKNIQPAELKQADAMFSLPSDEEIEAMGVKEYQDWTGAEDRKIFIRIAFLVKKRMIENIQKRCNGV